MRQRISVLLGIAACCGFVWLVGCQQKAVVETENAALSAETKAPNVVGEPKITFPKLGHDFGVVSPNRMNKADIKFTNTGQDTLIITKVSKCCGVDAKLAGEKTLYEPGESGAVQIEWRSGSQPMVFTRELIVHSNDSSNPAVTLTIKAKIELKVAWEPTRLRLVLDEENGGSENITIRCTDGRPFSITAFKSTGDCITADIDPSVEATEFVIEPKVNTEKLHNNLKGSITIGLTHPEGSNAIVLFDVLPEYTINPPLLIVFNAEPGVPIARKISILNNYEKEFGIDSMISTNGVVGIEVLNKRQITNGYQLEIELIPPESENTLKFMDEFHLVLDGGEKLPIRCSGYYKKTKPVTMTEYR